MIVIQLVDFVSGRTFILVGFWNLEYRICREKKYSIGRVFNKQSENVMIKKVVSYLEEMTLATYHLGIVLVRYSEEV